MKLRKISAVERGTPQPLDPPVLYRKYLFIFQNLPFKGSLVAEWKYNYLAVWMKAATGSIKTILVYNTSVISNQPQPFIFRHNRFLRSLIYRRKFRGLVPLLCRMIFACVYTCVQWCNVSHQNLHSFSIEALSAAGTKRAIDSINCFYFPRCLFLAVRSRLLKLG